MIALVVLDQGGPDPWQTVRGRLQHVLLRTDLWSDQIVVLRTIQTLTLLDVHHYSTLVRELGGYAPAAADSPAPAHPAEEPLAV